ncbi:ribonuclease [Rhizobium sp. L1K21]|uniref:ribonuclease T2 family protein n=1 Tax=Rhizobium sp. L1K21 TaxID=2954933 RepID=UPI0020933AD5|nr:ribonuclease [Rhizobium sp. L1K21]MCO6186492.1 ribonuclease [Rhizobium sp. L1K21]
MVQFIRILIAALLLAPASAVAADRAGVFDFYVLSLSWSPSWCSAEPNRKFNRQCDPRLDYRFIVHGLWPQFEKGYPQFCATRLPDRVPETLGQQYLDIIPSMGLIGHEWRKHGTCSGLDQSAYFAKLREAYGKIRVPPALANLASGKSASPEAIETAFSAANPGLAKDAIAVTCSAKQIEEVRICFSKDLTFRTCPEVDRQSCPLNSINIPPPP